MANVELPWLQMQNVMTAQDKLCETFRRDKSSVDFFTARCA